MQVVDEVGKPISPSKLTAPQIRVELEARGLMVEGTRKEIYKRLQVTIIMQLYQWSEHTPRGGGSRTASLLPLCRRRLQAA